MNIRFLKYSITTFIIISFPLALCNTVYALTESEMQAAVASQGKEAVAGNVFIWFLCAIAFLKISQKIDSFMSGLGVNVGHTGGNMMSEALIAAKALGVGGKGFLNKGFSGGNSSPGGGSGEKGGILSGGLAGVVGRSFNNSAMNAATGKDAGLFGKKAFDSSLKSGGDLAKDVIGKVAKGDIAKTGSITGETADKALGAYLGYDSGAAMLDSDVSDSSAIPTEIGGIDENTDNVTPVEAASAPEIGTPPEPPAISDVPGTSVPSAPETATDGASVTTAPEEIPMESTSGEMESAEMPDIGYSSDMSMDIGAQPEISSADSQQADTVTADENSDLQPETKIPLSPDSTDIGMGATPIPSSATSDGMPEFPEIIPDYDSAEDSGHPVTAIPDTQSSIPANAPETEAARFSDSTQAVTSSGIAQSATDSGTPQPPTSGAAVSSVHTSQPVIPQPSGAGSTVATEKQSGSVPVSGATPVQSNSAPVAVTQPSSGVSSSTSQAQTNTISNTANNTANTTADVNASAVVTQQEHINSPVTMPADSSVSVPTSSGSEGMSNMPQLTSGNGLVQSAANIPVFSNVEIGGGRIMGTETTDKHPSGIEFGMYNTAQYMKPEGDFTTVKTVDGAKWYKQYATPKVERTPIVEENGKIKYEEKIINKLPPVPRRKDKV